MFPAFTLVVLKTTKPAGWEVHVGRTAVPYSPHHLFLIPRFLISSKWSLFFPPLDHVTVVTSCNSIELKWKRNHIYSFFTQLEILFIFLMDKFHLTLCSGKVACRYVLGITAFFGYSTLYLIEDSFCEYAHESAPMWINRK